jgi:hypothetical protein
MIHVPTFIITEGNQMISCQDHWLKRRFADRTMRWQDHSPKNRKWTGTLGTRCKTIRWQNLVKTPLLFTNILNENGDRTLPWPTPLRESKLTEWRLPYLTLMNNLYYTSYAVPQQKLWGHHFLIGNKTVYRARCYNKSFFDAQGS